MYPYVEVADETVGSSNNITDRACINMIQLNVACDIALIIIVLKYTFFKHATSTSLVYTKHSSMTI